ncbi:MAG: hypothetical protein J7578_07115 [Chitinophagaceae bacterium]|nr:hypothetical protein [Chitinophagaceae bacterium]
MISCCKKILIPILLAVSTFSCNKSNTDNEPDPEHIYYKGWGANSLEDPEGTKFTLPDGIEFMEALHFSTSEDDSCFAKDWSSSNATGNGSLVTLCVSFYNKTNKPIRLELPPGLIFISRLKTAQNGILAERASYEVPAGKVDYHQFNLQCMNSGRDPSSHAGNYDLGPVTNVQAAIDLFKFIENKDLYKDPLLGAYVQGAVHDIGDEGKVSEFVWEHLRQLPNK